MRALYYLICLFLFAACNGTSDSDTASDTSAAASTTPALGFNIVAAYPHDTASFTQGLDFYDGALYEGTGNYGASKLRKVNVNTGKVLKEVALDSALFGEGIVVLNDTLYQLTWKEKKVLRYDVKNFNRLPDLPLNTEGWGITALNNELIVTDGSSNLYFYEPATFRLLRTLSVTEDGGLNANLNELEAINGFIYANQWQYNYILKIDPASGKVVAKMDLSSLAQRAKAKYAGADVLNGIAYNESDGKIYVTGKDWPELYEISFSH